MGDEKKQMNNLPEWDCRQKCDAPGEIRAWVLCALGDYEGRLTRYAARLVGAESAGDVVQHAFLQLCGQSPAQLDGHLGAWLFTVCRNRAMDLLKENRRMQSLSDTADVSESTGAPVALDSSPQADPAAQLESQETYAQLRTVVDTLPDNQREAVDLWSEGFDYGQIAEVLSCSEGNVRVLVHRALKRIREHSITQGLLRDGGCLPQS